jgi:small-conductance mechanosensitive channel
MRQNYNPSLPMKNFFYSLLFKQISIFVLSIVALSILNHQMALAAYYDATRTGTYSAWDSFRLTFAVFLFVGALAFGFSKQGVKFSTVIMVIVAFFVSLFTTIIYSLVLGNKQAPLITTILGDIFAIVIFLICLLFHYRKDIREIMNTSTNFITA